MDDLLFLERVSPVFAGEKELIPPPTLCPDCRSQRRLTFRNERNLYKRTSDATGQTIVSLYSPDAPFPVYEPEAWYGDGWDALAYGRSFDFSRPFFEQFRELRDRVPRLGLMVIKNENCPYVNQVWNCRNCHLCFDAGFCEDALHCYATYHSRDATDCAFLREGTLAYELVDCSRCYQCAHLLNCSDCIDAQYAADCTQCQHIAFCSNLRGKQYCLFNEQLSKDAWEKAIEDLALHAYAGHAKREQMYAELLRRTIRRATHNIQCEDCTGDYLLHSRNCRDSFDCDQSEDLVRCTRVDEHGVSSMDTDHAAFAERAYEGLTIAGNHILFSLVSASPGNSGLLYCDIMVSSSDCFGCTGLKHKKHCILNKQYTKEEYEALVPKIIEHMRKDGGALNRSGTPNVAAGSPATGSWGEFFPVAISPFAYNESAASEYFPLSKEEVLRRGWRWKEQTDDTPKVDRVIPAAQLPDSINDVPDDILHWVIECEATGRPFKIIKQELEFYRNMKLPIPRLHPDERHRRRMALRNPRKLWDRECAKCHRPIATSYEPSRPEIVYCEECYLETVY